MNHEISDSVKVYKSKDYHLFQFLPGNRPINDRKIKKIINEIDNGNDMLRYYPIQVKEDGQHLSILDGQHRFYLSKFFQRPVFYILVKENKSMPEIAKVNSNVEKWNNKDFISCYIKTGNQHYQKLQEFIERFALGIGLSIQLLSKGHPGAEGSNQDLKETFHQGLFEVLKWDEAVEIAADVHRFNLSNVYLQRGFIIAIHRIKKAGLISIEDLVDAFLKRPDMLTKQASHKEYIYNLEQIVNVGKHKRIVLI